mmetsp:Transcript_52263/g.147059  ORF Transcript_52263/g.147059 Transcript_52263/m.147059 type:complete len:287 (-) Transcript_52263:108-968(-)
MPAPPRAQPPPYQLGAGAAPWGTPRRPMPAPAAAAAGELHAAAKFDANSLGRGEPATRARRHVGRRSEPAGGEDVPEGGARSPGLTPAAGRSLASGGRGSAPAAGRTPTSGDRGSAPRWAAPPGPRRRAGAACTPRPRRTSAPRRRWGRGSPGCLPAGTAPIRGLSTAGTASPTSPATPDPPAPAPLRARRPRARRPRAPRAPPPRGPPHKPPGWRRGGSTRCGPGGSCRSRRSRGRGASPGRPRRPRTRPAAGGLRAPRHAGRETTPGRPRRMRARPRWSWPRSP